MFVQNINDTACLNLLIFVNKTMELLACKQHIITKS